MDGYRIHNSSLVEHVELGEEDVEAKTIHSDVVECKDSIVSFVIKRHQLKPYCLTLLQF